jgi:hypothetical protein
MRWWWVAPALLLAGVAAVRWKTGAEQTGKAVALVRHVPAAQETVLGEEGERAEGAVDDGLLSHKRPSLRRVLSQAGS